MSELGVSFDGVFPTRLRVSVSDLSYVVSGGTLVVQCEESVHRSHYCCLRSLVCVVGDEVVFDVILTVVSERRAEPERVTVHPKHLRRRNDTRTTRTNL